MTSSKDSQFLEVCKEPILTVSFTDKSNRVIIKTWIEIGSYNLSFEIISVGALNFLPIRSLH